MVPERADVVVTVAHAEVLKDAILTYSFRGDDQHAPVLAQNYVPYRNNVQIGTPSAKPRSILTRYRAGKSSTTCSHRGISNESA